MPAIDTDLIASAIFPISIVPQVPVTYMLSDKDTIRIRSALLKWYRKYQRSYPWRTHDATPYLVMVSEIMLQQTQASRVAELLPPFIRRFPNFQALAAASTAEVVRAWKGLGYNNRAVRLRDAARIIVHDFDGAIPSDEIVLRKLPGFGSYTAAAVATFVYGVKTVVIDVNVRRVCTRLLSSDPTQIASRQDSTLSQFIKSFIQGADPSEWYQAVMDLGKSICTARQPDCSICPLQNLCGSAHRVAVSHAVKRESKRQEPAFMGRPNRLWRGAVVELLRSRNSGLTKDQALEALQLDAADRATREWFNGVIAALVKDGLLISVRGRLRFAD